MSRYVTEVAGLPSMEAAQRAFLDWILDFQAVDDAPLLLSMLAPCDDALPAEYCDSLGLPRGSSFADAASVLGEPWGLA